VLQIYPTLVLTIYDTFSTFYNDAVAVTGQAIDYIAELLEWESNGFRWFLFDSDDDNEIDNRKKRQISPGSISIRIMLVNIKDLNISNGTMSQAPTGQTLEQAVEVFSEAVSSGRLSRIPIVLNDTETVIGILSAVECSDTVCNSTNVTELATALPSPSPSPTGRPPLNGGTPHLHLDHMAVFGIILAIYIVALI